ncbi:putative target SNARE [Trypanosoma grayi]|uniref:putative target SNARE n=1 Tax=Trypanosoma grayi TaxID=71804 RepID=UPI0004F42325|nr:putative target SNARE [Trypanosoma grayi]KEG07502.1 putative target SNARE [Trypanosoma grayi]
MSVIAADIDVYRFSDTSGVVQRPDTMRGLSQLMSIEAFGAKDALENVAESELCTLMRFCVNVKEQNVAFFLHSAATDNEEEVSFLARYRQVSHVALTRCKYLLYRLDGPRTQVMSENGYIPLVDLQQHAERTNKDTIVHYNLGIRSAQGLRRVALGAQSSAQLAELIDRLEVSDSRLSGNTLLVDMVHHLSHKAAAGKVSLTLREVNTVLPLLARMRREQPTGMMDSRFNRLLAVIETAIGTAMQEKRSVEELVDLVEGLAACDILPTTFKQVEMVLLRLMLTQTCSVVHVTRILRALSSLLKSGVSQVLLQSAASHATDFAKSNGSVGSSEAEQLIELLEALGACKYEALPGLIVFCRANCLTEDVQLCLNGRCGYASLLASAAAAMQHEDESFSQCLANESRHHFIEYARVKQEKDENRFVDCIHGLVTVGFGDAALSDDTRRALAAYLGSTCLTPERCGVMPAVVVASLLEDLLEWCAITAVPTEAVIAPLEAALIARFRSSSITADAVESSEELAEAACRVVSLQHVSQDLRKVAAEVLGSAILRAEAAADVQRPVAKPSQSFEVVALSTAEQEHNHMNTVLRYCAALQQSGMAKHVEELMV